MLNINELNKEEALKTLLNGYEVEPAVVSKQINELIHKGTKNITKVCLYGRVSTDKDEQESSLITQHTMFKTFLNGTKRQTGRTR